MELLIVPAAIAAVVGLVWLLVRIEENLGRCSQELDGSFSSRNTRRSK